MDEIETTSAKIPGPDVNNIGARLFVHEQPNPAAAARAVFDATARYHNPVHAAAWSDPEIDASYENVRALVLSGLNNQATTRERLTGREVSISSRSTPTARHR